MFDIYEKCIDGRVLINGCTQEDLETRLSELQRKMQSAKIPVMIVFEGWSASGKGTMISRLLRSLDPRGFKVYAMTEPNDEEKRYPAMHRYWLKLPSAGNIAIFDRSWYRHLNFKEGKFKKSENEQNFFDILDFESQLAAEGYLIIKIFLHISAEEQKKRFDRLKSVKSTEWWVSKSDLKQNENYDKVYHALCDIMSRTDSVCAPWHIIDNTDKDDAAAAVYSTVIKCMERALEHKSRGLEINPILSDISSPSEILPSTRLRDIDLSVNSEDMHYKKRLKECQTRLFELQNELYRRKIPLIIAYEGWDAAGKGGNIKRITQALDPRGYEVIPIASPTPDEKSRHFLWRFWRALPKDGHTAIFDRTWYGRVLVERIEGFASDAEWQRAYDEINRFEDSLANAGAIVVKFWLHIDSDEQLARFTARQNTPSKQWKITDEDWRNRAKWSEYETAVDEAIAKTNTPNAPWIIIESNDKKYARIRTLEEITALVEKRLAEKD